VAESPHEKEKSVQATCPQCAAPVTVPASRLGRRVPCPKCGQPFEVTASMFHTPLRESQTYVPLPSSDDEYALEDMNPAVREPPAGEHSGPVIPVADVPEEFAVGAFSPEEHEADEERWREALPPSERPRPPRWPMVNGVLTFFATTGAIICWSGFSVVAVVVLSCLNLAGGATYSGQFGPVASFLMGLIAATLAGVGLIAMTGFLMAILQESAAGNKVIIQWPELTFVDWVGGVFYFLVSLVVPVGVLHVLAWPVGGVFAHAWLVPVGLWVLFPVVLLSTLEMQSPLAPVSPVVLRSLWKCRETWAVFYLETGFMGLGLAVLTAGVIRLAPYDVGFGLLAGAVVAAAMLYFRLLGRLAWVCDDRFRQEEDEEPEEDEEEAPEDDDSPPIRPTPINDF